jgi:hypothetical protein
MRSLQRRKMAHAGKHDKFRSASARRQLPPQERLGLYLVGIPNEDGGGGASIYSTSPAFPIGTRGHMGVANSKMILTSLSDP